MMLLKPVEFFKLPMIRQASSVTFVAVDVAAFYLLTDGVISTAELLDFLKDGPAGKTLAISESFLEDGHGELLHNLREVIYLVREYPLKHTL